MHDDGEEDEFDAALEVHSSFRLRDRDVLSKYILASTWPERYRHLQFWSVILSNILKVASVNWMELVCVIPVFPLEPIAHSTLDRSRPV